MKSWIELDNVSLHLESVGHTFWTWWLGEDIPVFAETEYDIGSTGPDAYHIVRKYTGSVSHADVPLTYALNKYELFAFGASSIVAPLGQVAHSAFTGIFNSGVDLTTQLPGTAAFNTENTGHSAQFVHSYNGVGAYWRQLVGDIN